MQPSKPVRTFTDAELLARHQRRRRWIVRITLGSMLVLLLLGLGGLALTSTGMSIEEAEQIFKRLQSENASVSRAESLLGKPFRYPLWLFTKSSFNKIEIFTVSHGSSNPGGYFWMSLGTLTLTGWEAWRFRWQMLKFRLGFHPN